MNLKDKYREILVTLEDSMVDHMGLNQEDVDTFFNEYMDENKYPEFHQHAESALCKLSGDPESRLEDMTHVYYLCQLGQCRSPLTKNDMAILEVKEIHGTVDDLTVDERRAVSTALGGLIQFLDDFDASDVFENFDDPDETVEIVERMYKKYWTRLSKKRRVEKPIVVE